MWWAQMHPSPGSWHSLCPKGAQRTAASSPGAVTVKTDVCSWLDVRLDSRHGQSPASMPGTCQEQPLALSHPNLQREGRPCALAVRGGTASPPETPVRTECVLGCEPSLGPRSGHHTAVAETVCLESRGQASHRRETPVPCGGPAALGSGALKGRGGPLVVQPRNSCTHGKRVETLLLGVRRWGDGPRAQVLALCLTVCHLAAFCRHGSKVTILTGMATQVAVD